MLRRIIEAYKLRNEIASLLKTKEALIKDIKPFGDLLLKFRAGKLTDIESIYSEDYEMEEYAKRAYALEEMDKYSEVRTLIVFHGSCLRCMTPLGDGIIDCKNCKYFTKNWEDKNCFKGSE